MSTKDDPSDFFVAPAAKIVHHDANSWVGNKLCSLTNNYQAGCRGNLPRFTTSPWRFTGCEDTKAGLAVLDTLGPAGLHRARLRQPQ